MSFWRPEILNKKKHKNNCIETTAESKASIFLELNEKITMLFFIHKYVLDTLLELLRNHTFEFLVIVCGAPTTQRQRRRRLTISGANKDVTHLN